MNIIVKKRYGDEPVSRSIQDLVGDNVFSEDSDHMQIATLANMFSTLLEIGIKNKTISIQDLRDITNNRHIINIEE